VAGVEVHNPKETQVSDDLERDLVRAMFDRPGVDEQPPADPLVVPSEGASPPVDSDVDAARRWAAALFTGRDVGDVA
jgi:hypothetical protein